MGKNQIKINNEIINVNNIYYISTKGSDDNDGLNRNTAFKNLQHGINISDTNDCIIVLPGDHYLKGDLSTDVDYYRTGINLKKSIYIIGDNKMETRIIWNPNIDTGRGRDTNLINGSDTSNITKFINIHFEYIPKNGGGGGYTTSLLRFCDAEFYNCLFHIKNTKPTDYIYYNKDRGKNLFINSIFYFDTLISGGGYSGVLKVKNCISNNSYYSSSNPKITNSVSKYDFDIDDIFKNYDKYFNNDKFINQGFSHIHNLPTNIGLNGGEYYINIFIGKNFIRLSDNGIYGIDEYYQLKIVKDINGSDVDISLYILTNGKSDRLIYKPYNISIKEKNKISNYKILSNFINKLNIQSK